MTDDFGKRIKELRTKKGLTQSEFAERLGIHLQTVSKWERGISEPDISALGGISVVLGVSLERLTETGDGDSVYSDGFDAAALGKKIARLRRRRDESQSALASAAGVSTDTVSKWERGVVCPSISGLAFLAERYSVPLSELYYGADDGEENEESRAPTAVKLRKKRRLRVMIPTVASVVAALLVAVLLPILLLTRERTYTVTVAGDVYTATEGDWFTPTAKARAGYDFLEFRDGDGNAVSFPVRVSGDAEYFPIYVPHEYTVDYWLNGGAFDGGAVTAFTVEDEPIDLPAPQKSGADFCGWFASADYSGEPITTLVPDCKDISLYAKWNDNTYTVRYELGGGALFEQNPTAVTRERECALNDPVRSGYLFLGWFDAPSGGERQLSVGGENARNVTLYAVWQRSDALFGIEYELCGGTLDAANPTAIGAGEIVTLNSPSKAGYDFAGWFDDADGRGTKYVALYGLQDDIKLYAVFTPKTYTVVYELCGGAYENEANPNRIPFGTTVELLPVYKYGHTFAGWEANGAPVARLDADNIMNITELVAVFDRNEYTVTVDADGGVFSVDGEEYGQYSFRVLFDDELFLPECTRAGDVFIGFADERGNTVDKVDATNVGNITLTAVYRPAEYVYRITLDARGGSVEASHFTVSCNQIVALPAPTRPNYLFIGWNERVDGSGEYFERTDRTWESDRTLYAVWQELTVSGSSEFFTYEKGAAQVKITKYIGKYGKNVDVTVPSYIDGLPVVEVCFGNRNTVEDLHSVVLPSTLRALADEAFGAISISEPLAIPKSVYRIGKRCFCGAKPFFEQGSVLKEIGESAFEGARIYAPLVIPEGVERLASNAFFDTDILHGALILPSTLETIERGALKLGYTLRYNEYSVPYHYIDKSQKQIYLPDGVLKIERGAFGENDNENRFVFTAMTREQTAKFPFCWDEGITGGVKYIEHATSTLADGGETVEKLRDAFVLPERSKAGYTFIGWMDGSGNIVDTFHIPKNGDETLTATYEKIADDDGRDFSRPMKLEIGKTYEIITTPNMPFYFALDEGRYTVEAVEVVSYLPDNFYANKFYWCNEPLPSAFYDPEEHLTIEYSTAFNTKASGVYSIYNDAVCSRVTLIVRHL